MKTKKIIRHLIIKLLRTSDKEKLLKQLEEKGHITQEKQENSDHMLLFQKKKRKRKPLKGRRQWNNIFKDRKEKAINLQFNIK